MKNFIAIVVLSLTAAAFAQDTGQFEITKTNFKDLYNNYRFASPKMVPWSGSFFPYADYGTSVKLDKRGEKIANGRSPMEAYSLIPGGTREAEEWEKENHGCDNYDAATKKSCKSWWGHCNGWSAAAIKENEPRTSKILKQKEFSVADQKGILSELWLSSFSLNAGITDKDVKTGSWVNNHSRPNDSYRSFWDVTPKAFFLIFTNYVGVLKTGIVIDRFTGDEVWNQPVVGYRMLPIGPQDIGQVKDGNRSYWSVKIKMKIYWANDLGIKPGHVSKPFDIKKMLDNENVDQLTEDYEGRYLAFQLNFDSKVTVSPDGKTVLTAGKMVGDGIWEHQENSEIYTADEINHTHPDFIWLPTTSIQDTNGYGNPHIDPKVVQRMIEGREGSADTKQPVTLFLSFAPRYFDGATTTPEIAKKKVQSIIRRDGIKHAIYLRDIEISRNRVMLAVKFPMGVDVNSLIKLFEVAGMPVKVEK